MKIDFDISKVTHLKADINYTNIHFIDGQFMKEPFTLKRFEEHPALGCSFLRVNRGTLIHSVNKNYLQAYLNEFCYRINRSIHKNSIFENLIERMVLSEKTTKKTLKLYST